MQRAHVLVNSHKMGYNGLTLPYVLRSQGSDIAADGAATCSARGIASSVVVSGCQDQEVQAMSQDHGSSVDTDAVRRRLEAERSELLSKAGPPTVSNPLTPDERDSDEADAAVSTDLRERAMWLAEDTRQKIEMIEQALQRLERGVYSRCESCGGTINPERLEALPYATQCIRCQKQAEHQGRRQSGGRNHADG